MTSKQNFKDRTLWIRDNLEVMRGMNSETVDLIYLDPPFNSKRIYNAPLGSKATGAKFTDTWTMDSMKEEWTELQEEADPAVFHTVMGAGLAAGDSMQAYMCFMAPRLQECYRILKPTGSLYLHCDDAADSYLRQLLDVIFGANCRVNTVTWKRNHANNAVKRAFGRISDTIFVYAKQPKKATWNQVYGALNKKERARYRNKDKDGRRYKTDNMTAPRSPKSDDSRRFEWKGTTPSKSRVWAHSREVMDKLYSEGRIVLKRDGTARLDGLKRYMDEHPGTKVQSIWDDIQRIGNTSKERLGWPTQKPLALLERIISASSNEGDLVFDPFCGCATAMVAAERLGRRWAGCDIDAVATGITLHRLQDFADTDDEDGEGTIADQVKFPKSAPKRTDSEAPKRSRNIKDILWKTLGGVINIGGNEMRVCPGCGRPHYRDAFHIDHIVPKSKGGPDVDSNLQLLCGSCNTKKGNRMTMKELQASNGLTEAKHVAKEAKPTEEPKATVGKRRDDGDKLPVW